MQRIQWVKNTQNNEWFDLLRLNLDSPYFLNVEGVYIIWYVSPTQAKVIKIGHGHIGQSLRADINNQDVQRFSSQGNLKVSWAQVDPGQMEGVSSFLHKIYTPLLGQRPNASEIQVNLLNDPA